MNEADKLIDIIVSGIHSGDFSALLPKLIYICVFWVAVLVLMIIDLGTGIYKAVEIGEARTSTGLRRTTIKILEYFGSLLIALVFDILLSVFIPIMPITFVVSLFLCWVEAKSIREKAHDKKRRRDMKNAGKILVTLLDNKDDILQGVSDIIKDKLKEGENGT